MTGMSTAVIEDSDLPALFQSSDQASRRAQKSYLRLLTADLIFLVLGAILGGVSVTGPDAKVWTAILGGVSFGISVVFTVVIRIAGFERDSYGGRAVAESVKTLAWRYMICADPYELGLPVESVDKHFTKDLTAVLSERKYLSGALAGELSVRPQITQRMREVRGLDLEDRKELYGRGRIKDQRSWYSSKAATNRSLETVWFVAVIAAQFLAFISALLRVRYPDWALNGTGIFSALAASFLAWLQVKRYQELAQSYGLASQELGLIVEEGKHVKTEEELSSFVTNSESAISREHTLWIARRGTI